MYMSVCIYVFVCMKLLKSAFCFIPSVCVCACVCVCMNFLSFLADPQGVKRVQGFRGFLLATGSASHSKLSFVPSEESLLSNFSNRWLPLAAAPVGIWIHPIVALSTGPQQCTHHMDDKAGHWQPSV